jgi:hypothetical protein
LSSGIESGHRNVNEVTASLSKTIEESTAWAIAGIDKFTTTAMKAETHKIAVFQLD